PALPGHILEVQCGGRDSVVPGGDDFMGDRSVGFGGVEVITTSNPEHWRIYDAYPAAAPKPPRPAAQPSNPDPAMA
ncbi:MAG: hypothetical protein ACFB4J_10425, partial [Elainellaceae cyanobacterium]